MGKGSQPREGEIIFYRTAEGAARVEVFFQDETFWLTQKHMSQLFGVDVRTISEHLSRIFESGELKAESVIRKIRNTAADGKSYLTNFYNLDAIISVGYRVNSAQATQFRIWATQTLREYLIKGFVMDDARLKNEGGGLYFDELLARIRDIRSSEKVFWRKVLEIYATSIDYDPSTDPSRTFFATIQNKMHWAAHGQTAAEVISERADSQKPNMGLTTWAGQRPGKGDAGVAKNYLSLEEMDALNKIVSGYLDFAEVQALNHRPMHMADWISKLDDYLRLSERDILTHAGSITHEAALALAESEYEKFRNNEADAISKGERDFERFVNETKKLPRLQGEKDNDIS